MIDLTMQQLFGKNATQTTTNLIIQKADLSRLSAAVDNRAEQLLVALLLQAHQHFEGVLTDERGKEIIDEQDRVVTHDNRDLYEELSIELWQRQFIKKNKLAYIVDSFVISYFIKV